MFLFQKTSTYSHSRKSSRESKIYDRPGSRQDTPLPLENTSTAIENPVGRRRANTDIIRRTSVFGGRSRSTTATSLSSSYQSAASSVTSVDAFSSRRSSSQDGLSSVGSKYQRSGRPDSVVGMFFSRGNKKHKQPGSNLSISSGAPGSLTEKSASNILSDAGYKMVQKGGGNDTGSMNETLKPPPRRRKPRISQPYNFQHVTHTHPRLFPEMDRTTDNDLVTEFSAVRASQAPRAELQGINAEDLHFKNFSSEAIHTAASARSISPPTSPSIASPHHSPSNQKRPALSPVESYRNLRQARSADGFQTNSTFQSQNPSCPIAPPARRSSRGAVTLTYDPSTAIISHSESLVHHVSSPGLRSRAGFYPALGLDDILANSDLPHAVTTPDDTAWPLRPQPFTSPGIDLPDVPEEEEELSSPNRCSWLSSRPASAVVALHLAGPHAEVDNVGPLAIAPRAIEPESASSNRPSTPASDTLSGPYCLAPKPGMAGKPGPHRRLSIGFRGVEGCWEDDVDYCYDHAAEADCDYEWDTNSLDGFPGPADPDLSMVDFDDQHPSSYDELFSTCKGLSGPSLIIPGDLALSGLKRGSEQSASTTDTSPMTPNLIQSIQIGHLDSSSFVANIKESDGFGVDHSITVAPEYDSELPAVVIGHNSSGNKPLHDQYPLYSGGTGLEAPDRVIGSHHSFDTNYDSQESSFSNPASTTQKHMSTVSAVSVPDLVPYF